jgi:hypothetical protein
VLFVETNTPDMFVVEQRRDYTAFADERQCVLRVQTIKRTLSHV